MAGLLTPSDKAAAATRLGLVTDQTLMLWSALPFVWGASDCFLSVLDHAEEVIGRRYPDRPRYRSALEAQRILKRHGGFQAYCELVFARLGLEATEQPVRGDVGLVDIPGTGLTACVCLGNSWAARGEGSFTMVQAPAVIAWSVMTPGARMPLCLK